MKEKEKEEEGLKEKEKKGKEGRKEGKEGKEGKGKERGIESKKGKIKKEGKIFSLISGFPKCYRVMHSLDNKIKMRYLSI